MNYTAELREAILRFWDGRGAQSAKQLSTGKIDAGQRGAVTGGTHLNAVAELIESIFVNAGIDRRSISRSADIQIPGYYRPVKKWDLVVREGSHLIAAIELKSQVGSLGNNFNNRTEESIGSAVDVWRAYKEGRFGGVRPWLGYFFVLEDSADSTRIRSTPRGVFEVDPVFEGTSYADRYGILCKRLVRDRLYDAACFILSSPPPQFTVRELDPELGLANLVAAISGRAAYVKTLADSVELDGGNVLF